MTPRFITPPLRFTSPEENHEEGLIGRIVNNVEELFLNLRPMNPK
jgi:hypothetical protein